VQRTPIIIAYLGVAKRENDKEAVYRFFKPEKPGQVVFVEENRTGKENWRERKLNTVMEKMGIKDRLIVPELSRLGNSITEILEIMAVFRKKGINFYSIKEDFSINSDIPKNKFIEILDVVAQLEAYFNSIRVKETLKERTKVGLKIGRPRGPGKSKLDKHRREIIALLKNGSTKAFVAKRYNTTLPNLYNWLKKNKINARPIEKRIDS
jgi:DNA invertase Pin-like site-specific DNA recombinase